MDPRRRILAIDLLRGLDVWLMLFVNEMAGVRGTPRFLLHEPASADAMTITDVVFPAFLFITGMAIPLALEGRLRRGERRASVWRHVLTRTAALLVIGVLMVNTESASGGGPLSPHLWNVLMTIGVVLVWMVPGDGAGRRAAALRLAGVVLLVLLVFLYRAEGRQGVVQLRPEWWGILGLIGWAYLVGAALYLVAGNRPAVFAGAIALLGLVCLADQAHALWWLAAVRPVLSVGGVLGAHGALVVSGALLTLLLVRHRDEGLPAPRLVGPALGYAAALAVAGFLVHALDDVHPAFEISKIRATVAWALLSAAATAAAWVAVYVVADVRRWRQWPRDLTAAGENALVVYLLAPFLLSVFALVAPLVGGNPYAALGGSLWIGLVRSILFAWAVVRLAAWMRTRGLRLQL